MNLVLIACLGAAGALSRYGLDRLIEGGTTLFPVATFLTNILGSFFIGTLYVLGTEKNLISPELGLGLTAGFLASFTTFSSYALQTVLLAEQRNYILALTYFTLSPLIAFIATWLGANSTRLFLDA